MLCRRAATSGRSCSLACAVSFEGDAVAVEEPPHRARCERHTVLAMELLGQLDQRDVHLLLDRAEDDVAEGLDTMRALVTAPGFGCCGTCCAELTNPAYRGRDTNPEALRFI